MNFGLLAIIGAHAQLNSLEGESGKKKLRKELMELEKRRLSEKKKEKLKKGL